MSQTVYNLDPTPCLAGQVVEREQVVGMFTCSEAILPGNVVELSGGQLRNPRTAGAVGAIVGVAIYRAALEPNVTGYQIGEYVPVLRKGKIWVQAVATLPSVPMTVVNISSSSTIATDRGKVTASAVSAGAGTEVYAPPGNAMTFVKGAAGVYGTLALCEVNLP